MYKINGVAFPIQPTTGHWIPRQPFGNSGDGHPVYSGVREFEIRWGLLDATGTNQLQNYFNSMGMTGTMVAEIPQYAAPDWLFYAYTGCLIREPEFGVFFNQHTSDVVLLITNIRT